MFDSAAADVASGSAWAQNPGTLLVFNVADLSGCSAARGKTYFLANVGCEAGRGKNLACGSNSFDQPSHQF